MPRRTTARLAAALLVIAGLAATTPSQAAAQDRFTVTLTAKPGAVQLGRTAPLAGKVRPARPGVKVKVQEKKGSRWVTVARPKQNAKGKFSVSVRPGTVGTHSYRVSMPKVGKVKAGRSATVRVTVTAPPTPPPPPPPVDDGIVEFTIQPGTGGGSWNTQATQVVAEVGDVLRITNADAEAHRLHTEGDPFPHPSPAEDIAPGQTRDIPILTPFTGSLYCHNHSTDSLFWITVTEPAGT
jgi:hypothetical protein